MRPRRSTFFAETHYSSLAYTSASTWQAGRCEQAARSNVDLPWSGSPLAGCPFQQEGLWEPALSADLEGAEVEILLGHLSLLQAEQKVRSEGVRNLPHYSPKMACASSSLSRSDSSGSEDSLNRRARARKRSLSDSLAWRPVSMRSTRTRLALNFRVFAIARTRFATTEGSETL